MIVRSVSVQADSPDLYLARVDFLAITPGHLFCGSRRDPFLTVLDLDLKVTGRLGNAGSGPGEFSTGLFSVQAENNHLFVQTLAKRNQIMHFYDGKFVDFIPLIEPIPQAWPSPGFTVDLDQDILVVPALGNRRNLADVYSLTEKSEPQSIGVAPVGRDQMEIIEANPFINETLWRKASGYWWAFFRYRKEVIRFQPDFSDPQTFALVHPAFDRFQEIERTTIINNKAIQDTQYFTCVQVFQDQCWILSGPFLLRLNSEGKITGTYRILMEAEYGERKPYNFFLFAILPGGKILLSNPMGVEGQDFAQGQLP